MEKFSQEYCKHLHDTIDARLTQLSRIIQGNGHEGLVTKVAKLEQDMAPIKSDNKTMLRLMWIAMGAAIILQPLVTTFLLKHLASK